MNFSLLKSSCRKPFVCFSDIHMAGIAWKHSTEEPKQRMRNLICPDRRPRYSVAPPHIPRHSRAQQSRSLFDTSLPIPLSSDSDLLTRPISWCSLCQESRMRFQSCELGVDAISPVIGYPLMQHSHQGILIDRIVAWRRRGESSCRSTYHVTFGLSARGTWQVRT